MEKKRDCPRSFRVKAQDKINCMKIRNQKNIGAEVSEFLRYPK